MEKRAKTSAIFLLLISSFLFITASFVFASSHHDAAQKFLDRICRPRARSIIAVLCSFSDRLDALEAADGRHILDYGQVRGSIWETDSTVNIPTPDLVTVNCDQPCVLWVNYDVDTRNTEASTDPRGYFHLYHIYVDGVNQAVFNQASFPVPNVAVPLAVNGVFEVNPGEHTIAIYVKTNGGHLEQHESHLQVLAFER